MPLNDILEFKEKKNDELMALRAYIDELYLQLASSGVSLARLAAINKLEQSLADLKLSLDESGIPIGYTSLRSQLSGDFTHLYTSGLGGHPF